MNFPKNVAELKARLDLIEKGIPNQNNNFDPFAKPAFKLFEDCGLVTHDIVIELSIKSSCDREIPGSNFPLGGLLRHQDLPVFDKSYHLRYYSQGKILYVSLDGVRYYVSNHWSLGNKHAFYKWLSSKTLAACEKHWAENKPTPLNNLAIPAKAPVVVPSHTAATVSPKTPTREDALQMLIRKIDHLDAVNRNLCYLLTKLETRIETLEKKNDDLTALVENLNQAWK